MLFYDLARRMASVVVAFFAITSLLPVVVSKMETTIIFVSPVVTLFELAILLQSAKSILLRHHVVNYKIL